MYRRDFLRTALQRTAALSLGPVLPAFLRAAAAPAAGQDRVLVVLQLSGGNDGLNTVIPYADDAYYQNHFTLGIGKAAVLKVDETIGLHPSLRGFADLLEAGRLALVQGVGYPQPDRSHFSSMDIWHTARLQPQPRTPGWLGTLLDNQRGAEPLALPALHLGGEDQPRALRAEGVSIPTVRNLDGFRLRASDADVRATLAHAAALPRAGGHAWLDAITQGTRAALASSEQIQQALGGAGQGKGYPDSDLAAQFRSIARLIVAGTRTRIFYLTLNGFDTHARQADAHAGLLKQAGDAVSAFLADLRASGEADRALVMVFSEFGRRVRENANQGTDHGAAAPMFLAGPGLKPGPCGAHPSLTDLDDGDLRHHTDFRQVYATVLDRWLGVDSEAVLGARYEALKVFG